MLDSNAALTQVMPVAQGCAYQLIFSAMGSGDASRPVEVVWLDARKELMNEAVAAILIPPNVKPQFAQYSRVIGPVPKEARFVRLTFTKPGAGYLILDDVSLFRIL
jgi:hypothetical protein